MARYRKHGFRSEKTVARYFRISSTQKKRWTKEPQQSDHSYCAPPDLLNVQREEELSEDGQHRKTNEDWKLGRRIVEMDILAKGLSACEGCGLPLQIIHTKNIQTCGLGSLLKVQCFNTRSMVINVIPTGKRHGRVWDINTKLATALVHSGFGERQINNVLAELNIPTVSHCMINARLKEMGTVLENFAKETAIEALNQEVVTVEEKNEKLVLAVDAGWQKRGSGRSYDSLSGHCSMVGTQTGKIVNYSLRSKDCRVCTSAASRNELVRQHDCYRNWEESAKAMEADMVTEMVLDIHKQGFTVSAIAGDEDSSTIGRLRANVNDKIEKISDRNHLRKLLGNTLYSLKKQHPMLTVHIIKYLQRCFDYIIAQGEGDPLQIAADLDALTKHPFGDHQSCSSRWCKFLNNPKCLYKSFPHGKPLSNLKLQESLKQVFSSYSNHCDKLSRLGSIQANESFNRMVASKAPKNIHYSSSGNLSYRIAASVAQKKTLDIDMF